MIRNQEYDQLRDAALWMDRLHLWIDDSTGLSPQEVRVRARRLAGRCASQGKPPLGLVVVDYLQLMESGQRTESRQVEVTRISNGLKAVAKDLRVPVIALAQLNRQSEGRDGHRPRLSDLRESGAIEQDADVVLLLHREDYYKQHEADFMSDNIAEVIVAKQRNGPNRRYNAHVSRVR